MAKRSFLFYLSITIQSILGLFLFWNLIISVYTVISHDKIEKRQISKLSYGPVKISGQIKGESYGQVNFSTVNLNDRSGTVTILFGLYKNLESSVKENRRDKIKEIEVVGIYYPFISLVHAYYINGKITIVEYLMMSMYLVLAAFFFYSVMVSFMTEKDERKRR